MKSTATIGIAALLIGGAGGFFAGKAGSPESAPVEAADSLARDTRSVARAGTRTSTELGRKTVRDLDQALGEAGQIARIQGLINLYAGMNAEQLAGEAGKLQDLPAAQRMMASLLLFGRWGEVDPHGALAAAATQGQIGMIARPSILQSWASMDPVNASKYFSENPGEFGMMGGGFGGGGGLGGDGGAGTIAAEWAKLDPDAAIAWANSLSGGNQTNALRSIIGELATSNPDRAADLVSTLPPNQQAGAYGDIAQRLASSDFSAAESFIQGLPADSRERAMTSALEVLARTDPQAAAAKLSTYTNLLEWDRAVSVLGSSWARTDPAAAAAWVSQQQTENPGDALRPVISAWASSNSTAALAWINTQPQGGIRDEAINSYIFSNTNSDPQSTMQLAESISDEDSRTRSVMMATRRWMQQDSAAASAYLQQSTAISDEARQRILEGGGGGRGGFGGGGGGGFGGGGGRGGR